MMKAVLLLSSLLGLSHGFLFWGSSSRQQAAAPIDPTCENRAQTGDCGFYTCFDTRHPCTRHNWALSYGWRYCNRFNVEFHRFTTEAQLWINSTRTCTMNKMLTLYSEENVSCEHVEAVMKKEHARCEERHGACTADMVVENREALMDVYKISRRGMVRFLMFIKQCGGTRLQELLRWVTTQTENLDIVGWLGDQVDNIDDVIDRFKDLFD